MSSGGDFAYRPIASVALIVKNRVVLLATGLVAVPSYDQHIRSGPIAERSLKVGDGGNRKVGISWGCLTCPKLTSSS